jgi:hypothetical protein
MRVEHRDRSGTAGSIAPALRDGYELHRAALCRGMNVLLLPRQVLMVSPPDGKPELAFVHGIPETSSLAAVTYAQDKRMRRELLARADLPVPEGATFAVGREQARARAFAAKLGYPVVVKPAVGDNLSEVFSGIRNETELAEVIEYLRTPESERSSFTRTAYGLTMLLEPEEEDGRMVSPAGYQFLLERQVSGEYLRLLVVGDQVSSAVHCPGGLAGSVDQPYRDVLDEVHPSIRSLAVDAAQAVPGLAVAAVDLVLADHRRPVPDQPHWIVEFSERPWLEIQARVSVELAQRAGEAILAQHAAERSVRLAAPQAEVAVEFQLEGATDPESVVAAISAVAKESGVAEKVSVVDRVEGTAEGTLRGPADAVAWIFEALLDGQLRGQRAMLVEERHR